LPHHLASKDRKKVFVDRQYHTGQIISPIVSIEAKAFTPGWGDKPGGWIERIPVQNF